MTGVQTCALPICLLILGDVESGQHIRRQGEDLCRGDAALAAGTRLRAQEIGLLAALGHRDVRVARRPSVAILTTGDELHAPGSWLREGGIYDSNGPMLAALVRRLGAQVLRVGHARDTMPDLESKIRRGLQRADVLIVAGGVSVGEKDAVRQALARRGAQTLLWRVDIKPGMPLYVGRRYRTMIFGLPGNPVSALVTFQEFVEPALRQLLGEPWRDPYTIPAVLASDVRTSAARRTQFVRVRCMEEGGRVVAQPLDAQGSHQLRSLTEAGGWIRLRVDQGPWLAGREVLVRPVDGSDVAGASRRAALAAGRPDPLRPASVELIQIGAR